MLRVEDLHAGYRTAKVLDGISLEVADGESVALMGRNGMGKTTLLRSLARMTPPHVTAGTVELDGVSLLDLPPYRVARAGASLVPQGRQVFGSLTVRENLAIVPQPRGREAWTIERVFELFPRLAERERSAARTLSGGEQQMLAIGRALMSGPSLLLMDEPSEGLAPAVLRTIGERLQELRRSGLSVLVAEQNVDFALALADRVLILGEDGVIAWTGTRDELVDDPGPIHRYLGLRGRGGAPQVTETEGRWWRCHAWSSSSSTSRRRTCSRTPRRSRSRPARSTCSSRGRSRRTASRPRRTTS